MKPVVHRDIQMGNTAWIHHSLATIHSALGQIIFVTAIMIAGTEVTSNSACVRALTALKKILDLDAKTAYVFILVMYVMVLTIAQMDQV